jgi:ATP-binding cassette subfamily B protein
LYLKKREIYLKLTIFVNKPKSKIRRIIATLANLPKALRLIWYSGRAWSIAQISLLLIRGVLPAALVYLTKLFVDSLVVAIKDPANSENISTVIWIGAFFAIVTLSNELLSGVIKMVTATHSEALQDHIFTLIHDKSIKADLGFYEQPKFFDHLHRAKNEARSRPTQIMNQVGSFLQNGVTIIAMGAVLLKFGLWLPLILLVSALPAFYVVLKHNSLLHDWQRQKTTEERKAWYHDFLITNRETAAELRLFGLGKHFREIFVMIRKKLRQERLKLAFNQRIAELIASLLALLFTALAFIWIIWRTIRGANTLGDLALFYQAFNQGQQLSRMLLQDAGKLYSNSLFIGNLFEFLELEPEILSPENPLPVPETLEKGIEFENITFRYQNDRKVILNNFNLIIPANKITAIVGANGAGKSTLIKLICRFYDPEKGTVRFDDDDIRKLSLPELRQMITVLFQTPVHYSKTVEENIRFGSIYDEKDANEIERAARSAGMETRIDAFPKKYEQMLGHRFSEGEQLSIGEWQRIALARAFFRQAPLVLLDEPTSAMDPWAEADWLKRLVNETKGKTVLLITHRFTTAMYADLIYVMEKGEITEQGSHQELLKKNGRYAESWREQTQK